MGPMANDGPKTHLWGQAPRSNFSAGVRPRSEVFELAAVAFFVMKGVAAARILGTSWGVLIKISCNKFGTYSFFHYLCHW